MDFFLREALKSKLHQSPLGNLEELKQQKITVDMAGIPQQTL